MGASSRLAGYELVLARFDELLGASERSAHPLYGSLCAAAHHKAILIDLVLRAPVSQQRPNLLFAAIHLLALQDPEGPLAPWYPTARWFNDLGSDLDHPAKTPPAPSLLPEGGVDAVVEYCTTHESELESLLMARSTQTNEVGRSTVLLAGLQQCSTNGARIALIDLGSSAGLNLTPERYAHRLSTGMVLGDPASDVIIDVEVCSELPGGTPVDIAWRRGLDLAPLSMHAEQDALWLLACQWPDDVGRFERTRRAIRLQRSAPGTGLVIQGDLVGDLPALVSAAPSSCHVVVFNSWVAAYLEPGAQRTLAEAIRFLATTRPLSWLWMEHPGEVRGLGPPQSSSERIPGSSLLVLEEPPSDPRVLAQVHPHGSWIAWDDSAGSAGPKGTSR